MNGTVGTVESLVQEVRRRVALLDEAEARVVAADLELERARDQRSSARQLMNKARRDLDAALDVLTGVA